MAKRKVKNKKENKKNKDTKPKDLNKSNSKINKNKNNKNFQNEHNNTNFNETQNQSIDNGNLIDDRELEELNKMYNEIADYDEETNKNEDN